MQSSWTRFVAAALSEARSLRNSPPPSPRRQLYEVLAARGVAGRRLPVLLAANKADHGARAHTPEFVRRRLEKELCVFRSFTSFVD